MARMETDMVLNRLCALFDAAQDDRKMGGEIKIIPLDIPMPIPSRIDAVRDRRTGLNYAAWCIGETLGALGGMPLMGQVLADFEDRRGVRGASWLDHRWDGIVLPDGGMWVS